MLSSLHRVDIKNTLTLRLSYVQDALMPWQTREISRKLVDFVLFLLLLLLKIVILIKMVFGSMMALHRFAHPDDDARMNMMTQFEK